jgi:carboxyl-terminal processing protease
LEVSHAVEGLLGRGTKSLVIDLRTNPGGLLSEGVKVADLFLDPGQRIVSLKGRIPSANHAYTDSAKQQWPTLPIVVLVDGRSASAAEIVAGALQDHDRAVLVGRPTYGKGSAQSLFPLGMAGDLKLTTAKWYTPAGRSISKLVIDPDDPDADETLLLQHQKFSTDGGRTVYGEGGITPDVLAGDTTVSPADAALAGELGAKVGVFRDVITEMALNAKANHSITSPDFVVTPAMKEELWQRVTTRGLKLNRGTFDQAGPVISRLLGYEIARYVFGPDAEMRRRASSDPALAKAVSLATGVKSEADLLRRAAGDKSSAANLAK